MGRIAGSYFDSNGIIPAGITVKKSILSGCYFIVLSSIKIGSREVVRLGGIKE